MKRIKTTKIRYIVTVEVGCSFPEEFDSQSEFDKEAKSIKPYLREKISGALINSWKGAAQVIAVSIPAPKIVSNLV